MRGDNLINMLKNKAVAIIVCVFFLSAAIIPIGYSILKKATNDATSGVDIQLHLTMAGFDQ